MAKTLPALLIEARRAIDVPSQGALGELVGSSRRSGQRWERGEATPAPWHLQALARLVHPRDPELAAEIARAGDSTLEQLGIVKPPPPPAPAPPAPPPAPPPPDPVHIVDTVVCAAAEAMQLMPGAIRPALRAAFRRARLAGLSVEAVDAALTAPKEDGGAGETGARAARTR